ncbi:MAG: beta-eliminating lyase-related protein, partial [Parachlamydiaceae bacterium]|nr:beta-eliminating lyase-related protein [Parachlamydiaceae bacterium]
KLLTIPHQLGKLTPEAVLKKIKNERAFGKHSTSPRVLSIAQPTEVGTVYSVEELIALSNICKQENLLFHLDGSRFYNAVASLNIDIHTLVNSIELDILSLGGTKNGLLGAEALLIFNPTLFDGSDHLHKQTLQLLSKMRYLSAQYIPFFKNDLWRTLASHANQMAKEISKIIQSIPQLSLNYPVESNQIFFKAPEEWIPLIQEKIFCHLWDQEKKEIRLIASWNTTSEEIKEIELIFNQIGNTL